MEDNVGTLQTKYVTNPQAKLSQLLIKTDAQGNNTYYIYGLGLIGQEEADGTYKSYHFDNRGCTTALTVIQGAVTDTFAYAPFGELSQRTGTTDTPFLYNGRDGVMTDSNGLYYMRARYYNLDIKRFINQDVLQGSINNGQSMNRYAYVNGNPVSQVDPFGLCPESTNSNSWIHFILGGISFIPGLNVPASLLDFGLYLKEGDHVNAGIAMACIVPFTKEGVLGVKVAKAVLEDGSKVVKAVEESAVVRRLVEGAGNASRSNHELVQEIATRAENKIGRTGAVAGTKKHAYARDLLDRYQSMYGNRGLETETSWLYGSAVRYGTKGSARLDVYDVKTGEVFDYKFITKPGDGLSQSQINHIMNNGPAYITNVWEVNP